MIPVLESISKNRWAPYLLVVVGVALTSLLINFLPGARSVANISMVYVLAVTGAALWLGRMPAIFCALLSFFAFDYFFVEPTQTMTVSNPSEWLVLGMFLFTCMVTSQLTAMLKARAVEAQLSRNETAALAEASWAVASDLEFKRALSKVLSLMMKLLAVEHAAVVTINGDEIKIEQSIPESLSEIEPEISADAVRHVSEHAQSIGWESSELWNKALNSMTKPNAIYMPAILESEVLGVVYLRINEQAAAGTQEKRRIVQSLANHVAVVLQRERIMRLESRAQALAEADRLKTALLSMVSHDFRSPLTSIKASVGNLLEDGNAIDAPTQKSLLEAIDQETDRLNKLVGNILDYARLESGSWAPKREMTSIADLIGPALDALKDGDDERIEIHLEQPLDEIWIDSVQMVQVLKNLLENALKYSPAGSKVHLNASQHDGELHLEIIDSGSGFPSGEELAIFEPFYRAPGICESSVPGLGIGLAICKALVEAHGGKIKAGRIENGGSRFHVILPTLKPVEISPAVAEKR